MDLKTVGANDFLVIFVNNYGFKVPRLFAPLFL